ncbi:MAG TPA: uracil-DNA glycosylase family protein [Gemmatimonadaceae bacterium]
MASLSTIARDLRRDTASLAFAPPVTHVYHPLVYAWPVHRAYLERYGTGHKEVLLVGMNPGPFGMAQTGVPFGEVGMVRDWLGIEALVRRPAHEHPRRPVLGFACPRSEVSGRRFWGWARERFDTPEHFFRRFFVWNYCPLLFLEASGRNRTPDKLAAGEKRALFAACDRALWRCIKQLQPQVVVGLGQFAASRAREVLAGHDGIVVGAILHPSPANPKANAGWAREAERGLAALGVHLSHRRRSLTTVLHSI